MFKINNQSSRARKQKQLKKVNMQQGIDLGLMKTRRNFGVSGVAVQLVGPPQVSGNGRDHTVGDRVG